MTARAHAAKRGTRSDPSLIAQTRMEAGNFSHHHNNCNAMIKDEVEATFTSLIQSYLSVYNYTNAEFYAERLCAHTGDNRHSVHLLALCYYRSGQINRARLVLRDRMVLVGGSEGESKDDNYEDGAGTGDECDWESEHSNIPEASRYLLAKCCIELDLASEAELALIYGTPIKSRGLKTCVTGIVNGDISVPNGAAGLNLLGDVCRRTGRKRQSALYYRLALKLDPLMWSAFMSLCELGAAHADDVKVEEIFGVRIHSHSQLAPAIKAVSVVNGEAGHVALEGTSGTEKRVGLQSPALFMNASPILAENSYSYRASEKGSGEIGIPYATPSGGHDMIMASRGVIAADGLAPPSTTRKEHSSLWDAGAPRSTSSAGNFRDQNGAADGRGAALFSTPNLTPIQMNHDNSVRIPPGPVMSTGHNQERKGSGNERSHQPSSRGTEESGLDPSTSTRQSMGNTYTDCSPNAPLHAAQTVAARLHYETSPEFKPPYASSVSSDFYRDNCAPDGVAPPSTSHKTPRIRRIGLMMQQREQEQQAQMRYYLSSDEGESSASDLNNMTGISSRLSFSSMHSSSRGTNDDGAEGNSASVLSENLGKNSVMRTGELSRGSVDPVIAARTGATASSSSFLSPSFHDHLGGKSVGKRVLFHSNVKRADGSISESFGAKRHESGSVVGNSREYPHDKKGKHDRVGEERYYSSRSGPDEEMIIGLEIREARGTTEYRGIPTVLTLLSTLGAAYQHLCQYQCARALSILNSSDFLSSTHFHTGWVHHQIGRAYFELGKYVDARRALRTMQRLDPHRVQGLEVLSTTLWHLKKEVELCHLAQRTVEVDRLRPEVWCVVGNCFSLQKEHEAALTFFKRSIQLDSTFTYSHTLSGHEYVSNEDFDKAVQCFRSAIRVDDRHYNAWYGLGAIYFRQEKYDLAEYHFRKALAINPQSPVLHCHLGMVQYANAKPYEALDTLQRTFDLDPCNPPARYQRATILISLQRYEEALIELQRVRDMAPRESSVHFAMGKVYKKLGRTERAMRCFLTALDLDPKDNSLIKAAIDKLDEPDVDEDVSAF